MGLNHYYNTLKGSFISSVKYGKWFKWVVPYLAVLYEANLPLGRVSRKIGFTGLEPQTELSDND
jgi:hypothetical protein